MKKSIILLAGLLASNSLLGFRGGQPSTPAPVQQPAQRPAQPTQRPAQPTQRPAQPTRQRPAQPTQQRPAQSTQEPARTGQPTRELIESIGKLREAIRESVDKMQPGKMRDDIVSEVLSEK